MPWPFPPLTSRARRQVRVRVSDAGGRGSAWSEPLDLEVALLEPSDWAAVPITADGRGREPGTAGPVPTRLRRARRPSAGPPLRLRARRARHVAQRVARRRRRARTRLDAATDIASATAPPTSQRALAAGPNADRDDRRRGVVPRPPRLPRRPARRLRRRHRADRPARAVLRRRHRRDDRDRDATGGRPRRLASVGQPVRRRERRRTPRRAGLGDSRASTTATG